MNINELHKVVASHMESAQYRLHRLIHDVGRPYGISSGSWQNEQGIVVAYVTFSKDDNVDNDIEAIVCVQMMDNIAFTADICRSDGEVLAKIASTNIETNEIATLMAALCKSVEDNVVEYFEKRIGTNPATATLYGSSYRAR